MTGTPVKALQTDLTIVGYKVTVSGDFGSKTVGAVKKFQKAYKLSADGVVGPDTKKKLLTVLNKKQGDPSTAATGAGSGTPSTPAPTDTGGSGFGAPPSSEKVQDASLIDGLAIAAPNSPAEIVSILKAANKIAFKRYIYGGGHAYYKGKAGSVSLDAGYDCSGSVSFALHAEGAKVKGKSLLTEPLDSEEFAVYGDKGKGNWITIYSDPSAHSYAEIAGLRFDTVAQDFNKHGSGLWKFGDRWTTSKDLGTDGYAAGAFVARHPAGW